MPKKRAKARTYTKHEIVEEGRPSIRTVAAPSDLHTPLYGGGRTKVALRGAE